MGCQEIGCNNEAKLARLQEQLPFSMMEGLNNTNLKIYLDPSYYQLVETPYGAFEQLVPNEFDYNGELEGTNIEVTDGSLNGDNPFLQISTVPTNYTPVFYKTNTVNDSAFLSINTSPNPGEIYLFYDTGSTIISIED